MKYSKVQEFFAEFVGTFILIALGCGSVAMVTLFPAGSSALPGEVIKGGYTNIVIGWGLGVAFGVIVSARVSGAHLNPAISIALALTGEMPSNKLFHYILAQMFGAVLGALAVVIVFYYKWIQIDPNLANTQGVLSTFPAVSGYWPGFIDQVFGTFLLMFLVLAVGAYFKDAENHAGFPFIIGAIVLAIGISFGGMNGYAINPARDLGPRIILWIVGFKNNGFNEFRVWSVPIFGPIVGASLGAILYKYLYSKVSKN